MAKDLIVAEGQTLDLSEQVPPHLADAVKTVEIKSFNDLVKEGLVRSNEDLNVCLDAAQSATKVALEQFGPRQPVPGTLRRFDLQRYSRFIAGAANAHPGEAKIFWNLARQVSPTTLISRVTPNTDLRGWVQRHGAGAISVEILGFNDVTIESAATLVVKKPKFNCRHLLIKKTGKLMVRGSGVYLKADSIEGLQ